jgi:hypothetical protein
MPKLLSGNSQYTQTHSIRNHSSHPASSKSITANRTYSVHSRDREGSPGMEFEEFSENDDKTKKSDQIHKRYKISQDWSWLNISSSTTSVVQLTQQGFMADEV